MRLKVTSIEEAHRHLADRTVQLEHLALQVVVVSLVTPQDANTAAISTNLEPLIAVDHVSHGFLILAYVVTVLVFALELKLLQVYLGVPVHLSDLDLTTGALLWTLATPFLPRHQAGPTVDTLALCTFNRILDDHRANAATEVLRLFLCLLISHELFERQMSLQV